MLLRFAAIALLALPAAAFAQSATFDLVIDGKPSGKDVFTLAKDKHGYKLSSRYHYSTHSVDGDFLNNYKFTDAYVMTESGLSVQDSNPTLISYIPNKTFTEITMGRTANGGQISDFFPIKPNFFMLPIFDAGAVQVLLLAAVAPNAPAVFNIYVPGPSDKQTHGLPADAAWVKGPDATGMLDGKPATAHTFMLHTQDFRWIIYADDSNSLLECDLPTGKASYIRKGFTLTSPRPPATAFTDAKPAT